MDREKLIDLLENEAIATNTGYVEVPLFLFSEIITMLKEYKRQDGCPCTHCMEWECDEVCEEYKKWRDT